MTILTATIRGGRISVVVDRQLSRPTRFGLSVVNKEASKLLVAFCGNAIFAVTYTGVAVADSIWMDEAIASCLAFRKLESAMLQPGSWLLSRPVHELLNNLAFNLPIRLRTLPTIATQGLTLAVTGWHLRPRLQPFACELTWGKTAGQVGGSLGITRRQVAKHFKHFPGGLWLQALGDTGERYEETMQDLASSQGLTHDDIERYVVEAIVARSKETASVGEQCLALQLDPRDHDGQVQFTYYPGSIGADPHSFLTGWTLSPTMINSPTRESTSGSQYSSCNRYAVGGFSDSNSKLFIRTRLPIESMNHGGPVVISYATEKRNPPPTK